MLTCLKAAKLLTILITSQIRKRTSWKIYIFQVIEMLEISNLDSRYTSFKGSIGILPQEVLMSLTHTLWQICISSHWICYQIWAVKTSPCEESIWHFSINAAASLPFDYVTLINLYLTGITFINTNA